MEPSLSSSSLPIARPRRLAFSSVLLIITLLAALLVVAASASPAAAVTTPTDNFNRANGALGPNWTAMTDGALAISSQTVAGTKATYSGAIRTAETYSANQSSHLQITALQLTGNQQIGVGVRAQNGGRALYLAAYVWNNGHPLLRLYKRQSGSFTLLGSYRSGVLAAGTTLRLSATGPLLIVWQNSSARIAAMDSSISTGAPAVMAFGTPKADNWNGGGNTTNTPTFSVGGTVSGLAGTLVLQNGANTLTRTTNGTFTFATPLQYGTSYAVTVKTNPTGQTCTVTNGTGTMGTTNVTNVAVTCTTLTFSVGGTVSGLTGSVVLQDNGADDLTVTANGPFTFATRRPYNTGYAVTVKTHPTGQTCTVTNGTGTVGTANVTNVAVACTTTIGTGLVTDDFNRADGGLGSKWSATIDGAMVISGQAVVGTKASNYSGNLRTGETYANDQSSQLQVTSQLTGGQWIGVGVRAQNSGLNLYLGLYWWNNGNPVLMLFERNNGSWTQLGSTYPSGPLAAGTQLQLSAVGSTLTFSQDGVARITVTDTTLTGGVPAIMAYDTPTADNWQGRGATGIAPTYSVGGTVSGLTGGVVLQDNGADDLAVSANGTFTFNTALVSGTSYAVTVKTNPAGQSCTVATGTGTITANVTNVAVTCNPVGFSVQFFNSDANGVEHYRVTSANNGPDPMSLRVLRPTHPAAGVAHNFLYALPVEAGEAANYGDPISTFAALDAQDQYNLTIVVPSFETQPWYADDALDANQHYETFMANELQPWVKAHLATTGNEQHWLIGFSKSGIGGEDLILKHPDVFTLVASWDFPADMSTYTEFGADNYGTEANFQSNYRLTPAFVDAHKAPFTTNNRIWIGGYGIFQQDVVDYNALLTAEAIQFTQGPMQNVAHRWDSGWVAGALATLAQDSINLH